MQMIAARFGIDVNIFDAKNKVSRLKEKISEFEDKKKNRYFNTFQTKTTHTKRGLNGIKSNILINPGL